MLLQEGHEIGLRVQPSKRIDTNDACRCDRSKQLNTAFEGLHLVNYEVLLQGKWALYIQILERLVLAGVDVFELAMEVLRLECNSIQMKSYESRVA